MQQTIDTLAELKAIRFSVFDEIFCKETSREYFFKQDGGLTPDDLEIVTTAQGGNWRLVAKTGKGGSADGAGTIASQAEAEAGTENTKAMSALRTAQAIAAQVVSPVSSVHGRTGSVTAQAGDYAAFYAEKASGIVLQEVTAIDAGSFTANGSLTNVNVANVSITPKSASSIIIVDVQFQAVSPLLSGTNTNAHYRLYETTASADIGAEIEHTGAAESQGVRLAASANIRARLSNSATSARTFQLRARTSQAGAPAYATSMVWSIREIAA